MPRPAGWICPSRSRLEADVRRSILCLLLTACVCQAAVYKNKASQKIAVFAVDGTGAAKTGDSANISATISKDGDTTPDALDDAHPDEIGGGVYAFNLLQAETNADLVVVIATSTTSGVVLRPVIVYTEPETRTSTLANGAHGGASASLTLGAGASISNASGTALTLTSSGGNGHGMLCQGNGTGSGIAASGGATDGNGIYAVGDTGGNGIFALSGDGTVAAGMLIQSQASISQVGLYVDDGMIVTNGAGDGLVISSTGGDGDAVQLDPNGTGTGLRANAIGSITGNLSGSVGSVTGAVGSVTAAVVLPTGTGAGQISLSGGKVTATLASGDVSGNLPADIKTYTVQPTVTGATLASAYDAAKTAAQAEDIPAAADIADSVWNEVLSGHTGVGSAGLALAGATAPTAASVADAVWDEAIAGHSGAGSAGLALSGASAPSAATVADAVWDELIAGHSGAGSTGAALSGASAPSAASVADAVWDEILSGHTTVGSAGAGMAAAGSSGDPWSTALPGAYEDGSAGYIIGSYLNSTVAAILGKLGPDFHASGVEPQTGTLTAIVVGDDYTGTSAKTATLSWSGESITGATAVMHLQPLSLYQLGKTTSTVTVTGLTVGTQAADGTYPVTIPITAATTATLAGSSKADKNYAWEIQVTVSSRAHTVARGTVAVLQQIN